MTVESSNDTSTKFLDILRAMFGPDMTSTALGIVNGAFKMSYRAMQPADSNVNLAAGPAQTIAGNVAYTHTLCSNTQSQMTIEAFKITTTAALSQAATNIATIALVYNNGNGGSDTTIASGNTAVAGGVANTTAGVPSAISITAANQVVPVNSCLQIKVTKSGASGKELPAIAFDVISRLGT